MAFDIIANFFPVYFWFAICMSIEHNTSIIHTEIVEFVSDLLYRVGIFYIFYGFKITFRIQKFINWITGIFIEIIATFHMTVLSSFWSYLGMNGISDSYLNYDFTFFHPINWSHFSDSLFLSSLFSILDMHSYFKYLFIFVSILMEFFIRIRNLNW